MSISADFAPVLIGRLCTAERYLMCLEESLAVGWEGFRQKCLEDNENWVKKMALVHPKHLAGIIPRIDIQGPRAFTADRAVIGRYCSAERIWGIACKAQDTDFSSDHLFPYSLGGPTEPSNRRLLCVPHNLMKGSDVHLYPWEEGPPRWLDQKVALIASRMK